MVLARQGFKRRSIPQDGIHELFEKRLAQNMEDIGSVGIKALVTPVTDQALGVLAVGGIRAVFPDHRRLTGQMGTFEHKHL